MERKHIFDAIMVYIPNAYCFTVDAVINYLKRISKASFFKRIDLNRTSLEIDKNGVTLIDYDQHKSDFFEFTWRSLEHLLLEFFPRQSFDLSKQTSLFGSTEIQLNNIF